MRETRATSRHTKCDGRAMCIMSCATNAPGGRVIMSQENPLDIGAKDKDRRRRMARGVFARDTEELDMPLNIFFGDDLLMILYRTEANNFASARVRTSLQIVSDKNQPRHIRALFD